MPISIFLLKRIVDVLYMWYVFVSLASLKYQLLTCVSVERPDMKYFQVIKLAITCKSSWKKNGIHIYILIRTEFFLKDLQISTLIVMVYKRTNVFLILVLMTLGMRLPMCMIQFTWGDLLYTWSFSTEILHIGLKQPKLCPCCSGV